MKLLSLFAKTKLNIFCSNITFALYLQQILIQKYVSVGFKHDLTIFIHQETKLIIFPLRFYVVFPKISCPVRRIAEKT